MYKGIKNLYLIKGKIVFRAHFRKNGQEKHVWKVLGRPEEFTEKELKKKVEELLRELWKGEIQDQPEEKTEILPQEIMQAFSLLFSGNRTTSSLNIRKQKWSKDSITLGELVEKFLNWYREERAHSSYVRYRKSAKKVLEFFGKGIPVSEINQGKIEEYKMWRRKQGVKPVTINKELRFLATMINRAVEFEWIPEHKLYKKPFLIKRIDNLRIRFLSEEEEKALLNAIKDPLLRDLVIFAINTGLRKGEIFSLKWKNVDLKNRCIVLEPDQTKNRKRHVLPLNEVAANVILKWYRMRKKGCDFVFHRNGKQIKCIRNAFRTALKRAGIKDLRFHDLRHTFASRLVQKNVDLYVVKELLNHSDVRTTQRYAHLKLDNLKKAVEVLKVQK